MEVDGPTISIDALFDESGVNPNESLDPHPRDLIMQSDLIFAVDSMSRQQVLVFGRETLERIVERGVTEDASILRVELDQETDDLERLIALVQVLRGRHDYKA